MTGLPLTFTLECNYDSGMRANALPPRHGSGSSRDEPADNGTGASPNSPDSPGGSDSSQLGPWTTTGDTASGGDVLDGTNGSGTGAEGPAASLDGEGIPSLEPPFEPHPLYEPRYEPREEGDDEHLKYTPPAWQEVGRALAVGLLDMSGANPASRLGPPDELELHLQVQRMRESCKWFAEFARCDEDDEG